MRNYEFKYGLTLAISDYNNLVEFILDFHSTLFCLYQQCSVPFTVFWPGSPAAHAPTESSGVHLTQRQLQFESREARGGGGATYPAVNDVNDLGLDILPYYSLMPWNHTQAGRECGYQLLDADPFPTHIIIYVCHSVRLPLSASLLPSLNHPPLRHTTERTHSLFIFGSPPSSVGR